MYVCEAVSQVGYFVIIIDVCLSVAIILDVCLSVAKYIISINI